MSPFGIWYHHATTLMTLSGAQTAINSNPLALHARIHPFWYSLGAHCRQAYDQASDTYVIGSVSGGSTHLLHLRRLP
jgi:hypothetical protein